MNDIEKEAIERFKEVLQYRNTEILYPSDCTLAIEALQEKHTNKLLENACQLVGQDFNCHYNYVVECLQAQANRDNPQPLTLEQLKQRVGKPVYTIGDGCNTGEWELLCCVDDYCIRCCSPDDGAYDSETRLYGETWLAYDHESKEQVNPPMENNHQRKLGENVPFERIRRITGYLVGGTDKFNDAKRQEEKDRVKHGIRE